MDEQSRKVALLEAELLAKDATIVQLQRDAKLALAREKEEKDRLDALRTASENRIKLLETEAADQAEANNDLRAELLARESSLTSERLEIRKLTNEILRLKNELYEARTDAQDQIRAMEEKLAEAAHQSFAESVQMSMEGDVKAKLLLLEEALARMKEELHEATTDRDASMRSLEAHLAIHQMSLNLTKEAQKKADQLEEENVRLREEIERLKPAELAVALRSEQARGETERRAYDRERKEWLIKEEKYEAARRAWAEREAHLESTVTSLRLQLDAASKALHRVEKLTRVDMEARQTVIKTFAELEGAEQLREQDKAGSVLDEEFKVVQRQIENAISTLTPLLELTVPHLSADETSEDVAGARASRAATAAEANATKTSDIPHEALMRMEQKIIELEAERDMLRAYKLSDAKVRQAEERVSAVSERGQTLIAEEASAASRRRSERDELLKLQTRLDELKAICRSNETQMRLFEEDKEKALGEANVLKKENLMLLAKQGELEGEVAALKERMSALTGETTWLRSALEKGLTDLGHAQKTLDEEKAARYDNELALSRELATLRADIDANRNLTMLAAQYKQDSERLRNGVVFLEQKYAEMERDVEANDDQGARAYAIKNETTVQRVLTMMTALEQEHATTLAKLDEVTVELGALKEKATVVTELNKVHTAFRDETNEREGGRQFVRLRLTREVETLREERDDLRQRNASFATLNRNLQEEVTRWKLLHKELDNQITNSRLLGSYGAGSAGRPQWRAVDAVAQERDTLVIDMATLKMELQHSREENDFLKSSTQQHQADVVALKQAHIALTTEYEVKREEFKLAAMTHNILMTEHQNSLRELENLREQIKEERASLDQITSGNGTLRDRIRGLQQSQLMAVGVTRDLRPKLLDVQATLRRHYQNATALRTTISRRCAELAARYASEVSALSERCSKLEQHNVTLEERIELGTVRSAEDDKRKEIFEKRIVELKEELAKSETALADFTEANAVGTAGGASRASLASVAGEDDDPVLAAKYERKIAEYEALYEQFKTVVRDFEELRRVNRELHRSSIAVELEKTKVERDGLVERVRERDEELLIQTTEKAEHMDAAKQALADVETLRAQLGAKQQEVDSVQATLAASVRELSAAKAARGDVEQQEQVTKAQLLKMVLERDNLNDETTRLTDIQLTLADSNRRKTRDFEHLNLQNLALQKEHDQMKLMYETLNLERDREKADIDRVFRDHELLRAEYTALQRRFREMDDGYRQALAAGDKTEALSRLTATLSTREAEAADTRRLQVDLQRQLADVQKQVGDKGAQLVQKDAEVSELRRQVAALQAERSAAQDREHELGELRRQLSVVRGEKSGVAADTAELRRQLTALQGEKTNAASELARRDADLAEVRRQLANVLGEKGGAGQLAAQREAENAELRRQMSAIKRDRSGSSTDATRDAEIAELRRQLVALQGDKSGQRESEVSDLKRQVATLQGEKARSAAVVAQRDAEIGDLNRQVAAMRGGDEAVSALSNQREGEMADLRRQLAALQGDRKFVQESLGQREAELADARRQLAAAQGEKSNLAGQLEKREAEGADMRRQLAASQGDSQGAVQRLTNNLRDREAELADLRRSVAAQQGDKSDIVSRLSTELGQRDADVARLERQVAALQGDKNEATKKAESSGAQREQEVAQLKRQLNSLQEDASDAIGRLRKDVSQRDADIDQLKRQMTSAQGDKNEAVSRLSNELNQREAEVAQLQRQNAALQGGAADNAARVSDQLQRREAELAEAQRKLAALQAQHEDLTTDYQRLADMFRARDGESSDAMVRFRHELDRARDDATRAGNEVDRLRGELQRAADEITRQRAELARSNDDLARARAECDRLRAALRDNAGSAAAAAAGPAGEAERLRGELARVSEDLMRTRDERDRLRAALRDGGNAAGAEVDRLRGDLARAGDEVLRTRDERDRLRAALREASQAPPQGRDAQQAEIVARELGAENTILRQDLARANDELTKLDDENRALRRDYDQGANQNQGDAQRRIAELEAQNQDLQAKLADLQRKYIAMREQHQKKHEMLKKAKEIYNKVLNERNQLSKVLQDKGIDNPIPKEGSPRVEIKFESLEGTEHELNFSKLVFGVELDSAMTQTDPSLPRDCHIYDPGTGDIKVFAVSKGRGLYDVRINASDVEIHSTERPPSPARHHTPLHSHSPTQSRLVKCTACGQVLPSTSQSEHDEICSARPSGACPDCGVRVAQGGWRTHVTSCPNRLQNMSAARDASSSRRGDFDPADSQSQSQSQSRPQNRRTVKCGVCSDMLTQDTYDAHFSRHRDEYDANKAIARLSPVLGLRVESSAGGVRVVDVKAGQPAEAAGMSQEDIIVSINEVSIATSQDFQRAMKKYGLPGEKIWVEVIRDGQPLQTTMTVGASGMSAADLRRMKQLATAWEGYGLQSLPAR